MMSHFTELASPGFLADKLEHAWQWLALCASRRRERKTLGDLTDEQLRDVGLTRREALREAARWPWQGGWR